ncbi:MAG: HAD-IA family hydrolase, partial [Raoultibacter sp.]
IILESMQHAVDTVLEQEIPPEILMAKVGQPLAVQMKDFTSDEAVQEELLHVYRAYNKVIHDERVRAFPGVAEVLQKLRGAGLRLGIVTSKRHNPALDGLRISGIEQYFEFVVGADDWPEHKPDPGPIFHAADVLGLKTSQCVYVGDSPYDIQAGNAAGCVTIAALWGMFSREALRAEMPDFESDDIRDVLSVLGVKEAR